MNKVVCFFLILFPFALLSSNNVWSTAFGNPQELNVERFEIEKEFKCKGVACLDVIPFKVQDVSVGGYSLYSGKAVYKEHDKEYYNTVLLKDLRQDDIRYKFFKGMESYFENNDLLTVLGLFFFLSILSLRKSK